MNKPKYLQFNFDKSLWVWSKDYILNLFYSESGISGIISVGDVTAHTKIIDGKYVFTEDYSELYSYTNEEIATIKEYLDDNSEELEGIYRKGLKIWEIINA